MVSETIAEVWILSSQQEQKGVCIVSGFNRLEHLYSADMQYAQYYSSVELYGEDWITSIPESRDFTPASYMVATYSEDTLDTCTVQTKESRWVLNNCSHGSGKENVLKWHAPCNPRNRG